MTFSAVAQGHRETRFGTDSAPTGRPGPIVLSIVSHGQRDLVGLMVADLARLAPAQVGLLVVTLNMPEADPEGLAELPFAVQVIRNAQPKGFGANHNQAFAAASAHPLSAHWQAFAVLNPDLRFDNDPFPTLLAALLQEPTLGLVSPRILNADGSAAHAARPLYTPWEIVSRFWKGRSPARSPDWIAGMFMLLRVDCYRALGGFDRRYFMYIEDVDLCARLRHAGWALAVVPQVAVVHHARYSSHRSLKHLRWHITSMLRFWCSAAFWRYWALLRQQRRAIR